MIHGRQIERPPSTCDHADETFARSNLGSHSVFCIAVARNCQQLPILIICEQDLRMMESKLFIKEPQRDLKDFIERLCLRLGKI